MKKIIEKYLPPNVKIELFNNLAVFEIDPKKLISICSNLYFDQQLPLKLISALDDKNEEGFKIFYIFGIPRQNIFIAPFIRVTDTLDFPSIVNIIHEASGYERRIKTFFGLNPVGHPTARPIILHENWPNKYYPLRSSYDGKFRPEIGDTPYQFQKVKGEGIYEIPVGPVHAGIIEPGHFRFSVLGEEIILLEPRLGYKHKGIEKLFETLPLAEKVKLSERVSGDSSFGHSLAFCQALESLMGVEVPEKAQYLRVIFAEMERLANHLGDIGAMMLDTGFGFGGSHGARLRELIMRWNERLTGNRFLRGVNTIGGVNKDVALLKDKLAADLKIIENDFSEVIEIAKNSSSLLNRLKKTGILTPKTAADHGVVGVPRRAIGGATDARLEFPYAAYNQLSLEIATEDAGDVHARFCVRVKEVYSSIKIIIEALAKMPETGEILTKKLPPFKKQSYAVGITEGWRGEIVYFVATDATGNISRVEPRDPSFLNWAVLGYAGKGNLVPDFPLINKSFNLSYSGNDL